MKTDSFFKLQRVFEFGTMKKLGRYGDISSILVTASSPSNSFEIHLRMTKSTFLMITKHTFSKNEKLFLIDNKFNYFN